MKLYIAKLDRDRIGGGWSFQDNFAKGLLDYPDDLELTNSYDEADVYFITSPSMVQRDEVKKAKDDGKKIVLRIDNAVRNSRNRNTGMSRMKDFAEWADLIVFQSHWAKEYLDEFLDVARDHKTAVILNGVDITLFKPPMLDAPANHVLYSRFNRDETKNFEVARYWYSRFASDPRNRDSANLYIVGQFSQELRDGNFDFYNGETYRYLGVLDKQRMADLYKQCGKFLYTYFNDACSNTLIEALCSGCEIVGDSYYQKTGGAAEIIAVFDKAESIDKARKFFSIERMVLEYKQAIKELA